MVVAASTGDTWGTVVAVDGLSDRCVSQYQCK